MTVLRVEFDRLRLQIARTSLRWWLIIVVVAPGAGAALINVLMGPMPLLDYAVWVEVIPLAPLFWAFTGLRWAESDQRAATGALKGAWPVSPWTVWIADFLLFGGLALASSLLTLFVLFVLVPAWRTGPLPALAGQAGAAWLVLASGSLLMAVWGAAVGTFLEGAWAGVLALAAPVAGFLANLVVGVATLAPTTIAARQAATATVATSFVSTTPWGFLVDKANDIWGFGPYQGTADALLAGIVLTTLFGISAIVGRQYGWARRGRALVPALALGAVALAGVVGVRTAAVNRFTALPHPIQRATGGARQELVQVHMKGAGGIAVRTTVWPDPQGLTGLWLDPSLILRGLMANGHSVSFQRTPSGWILFPRESQALTLSYAGNPLATGKNSSYPLPVVTNFANANGALLTVGGWYPLTPEEAAHPEHPPVMRFGLGVTGLGPWQAVSNLGKVTPGHTAWRKTTGLELIAGTLEPSAFPGFTVWTGPTEAWVWDSSTWDVTVGRDTHGGAYRYAFAQEARFLDAAGVRGSVLLVGLPWWAGPGPLLPLGNPNPGWPLVAYAVSTTPMPGTIGLASSAGTQYSNLGNLLGGAALVSRWANWSPAWLETVGNERLPAYQAPTVNFLEFVALWWIGVSPAVGTGNLDTQFSQAVSQVPAGRRIEVFGRFMKAVRNGHWPTWSEVHRLIGSGTP